MNAKYFLNFFIALLSLLVFVSGQERDFNHVIANSEDWRDVYSIIHYANIKEAGNDFLVSTRHGPLLLNTLNKNNAIRVISSRDRAYTINYKKTLEDAGFNVENELFMRNPNLELIEDIPEVGDFIIVGNTYGQSAIAVVPYATQKKAWIFFADRKNIGEIDAVLSSRDVNSVLIYGPVDREVKDELNGYGPEIIDNRDRFEDNIEIVDRYLELKPTEQVSLTNGDFIEKSLMSGFDPILFTGKQNVPEQISEYLKESNFKVGVLIGSDLVGAATNIRRSTGISVIVKFAQAARTPTRPIAAGEGLDLFYMTAPVMDLSLHSAKYNLGIKQLEITYKSNSSIPVYFKGTITPVDENGKGTRIGDIDEIFIAPNDFKTVVYQGVDLTGSDLSAEVFTVYGDSPSSLERVLEETIGISMVDVIDKCEINVDKVIYSKPKDAFLIKISNMENIDCWVDVELIDVIVDDVPEIFGSDGSVYLSPGKKGKVIIEQELTDEDLLSNSFVELTAYYGEKEDSLVKVFKGRFELDVQIISAVAVVAAVLILLLLIFLIILWRKKRRGDDWI